MDRLLDVTSDSYQLYLKSQRVQWRAADIDLSVDAREWPRLDDAQRTFMLATLAAFGIGEATVARALAPLALVLDRVEDQMYVTVQMFEEAKHADVIDRYFREVVAPHDGDDVPAALARAVPPETLAFYAGFFDALEARMRSLLHDRSLRAIAAGIAHYHVALEGSVSQREFAMVSRSLERWRVLPGLQEIFGYLRSDEGRHVMFGLGVLKRLLGDDPAVYEVVADVASGVLSTMLRDGNRLDCRLRLPPLSREELFEVLAREFAERLAYLRGRPVTRRFLLVVKARLLEQVGRDEMVTSPA